MKIKQSIFASLLAMVSALPGISATLTVTASAIPDGALYDYSYQFSIAGSGAAVDNIFLGSNDLSPLKVVQKVDGNPTSNWSWLGNDTPQNYLQFFDTNGTSLGNGDVLAVTFSSALAPAKTEFAVGEASSTSATTNTVTGLLAPSAVATPEPGSLTLLVSGLTFFSVARRRWTRRLRG